MKKKILIAIGFFAFFVICAYLIIVFSPLLLLGTSEDSVEYSVDSPGGQFVTTLFYRDVGATAPISTILTIRESDRKFRADKDTRILVLRHQYPVTVRWEADDRLTVIVEDEVAGEDVFAKLGGWHDVEIEYIPSTLTVRDN